MEERMPARNRSNPLALAVMICLAEQPMHPYEVATTLRQRHKHDSVRLNYGSLYGVVESLERRGLIAAQETKREGRLPERTVYRLTDAGRVEVHDWLTELISTPVREYPAFEAALSFLPALPPDQVVALLQERARQLEIELAQAAAIRELAEKSGLPRLVWVEHDFESVLRVAELGYVHALIRDIESGALEGMQWWRQIHERADDVPSLPPPHFSDALAPDRSE
jgi:DNA-binding PadR family transcriptional regulator